MTYATANGIVKGKKYLVRSAARGRLDGQTVVLDEDDSSSCPYFRIVKADGSLETDRVCITVDGTDKDESLTEIVDGSSLEYKIEVGASGTTISTNRKLSFQQVQDITRIIGAV